MFEETLAVPVRANRTYATMFGFLTQSVLLTAAVTVPMLFPDTLPQVRNVISIFTPGAPAPPPPPPGAQTQAPRRQVDLQIRKGTLLLPTRVPDKAQMLIEEPLTAAELTAGTGSKFGVVGGSPDGVAGGIFNTLGQSFVAPKPPAPAPRPEPAAAPKAAAEPKTPIHVGGKVQEAMLTNRVIPPYPPLAKQARIQGVVQLSGWISTSGRIRELTVVSGHPLLVRAALDAVSQWVYRPTLLNGEPVEVIAPISVHFILN